VPAGGTPPRGHQGGVDFWEFEEVGVDPSIAPGLPRAFGWRVGLADGTKAWDKTGPLDTDWTIVGGAGGPFPGFFAGAPSAIGPDTPGASGLASRGDHTHPWNTVATSAALGALDAATMVSGQLIWMTSRGAIFRLTQSALTVNSIDVFAAFNKAGWQWLRIRVPNLQLQAVTAWHVDPQSVQAAASDDNNGTAAATPLASMLELSYRTEQGRYATTACVTRLYSDMAAGDFAFFNVRGNGSFPTSGAVSPAAFDSNFTIVGVPRNVTAFAGVVANVQTAVRGGLLRWQFTDAGIPASWTASGFLARNLIFVRTNGTAAKWWPTLDQGGAAPNALLQISQPTTATGSAGAGQPLLVNGDTYQIVTLPKLHRIQFPHSNLPQTDYQIAFVDEDTPVGGTQVQNGIIWSYCNFGLSNGTIGQFFNCQFPSTWSFGPVDSSMNLVQLIAGTFRGTAAGSVTITRGVLCEPGNEVGAFTTFQNSRLTADEQSRLYRVSAMFYDRAAELIRTIGANSTADVEQIGGTGNTSKILLVSRPFGVITYDNAPNVAMTTDANPFQIGAFSQATLPFFNTSNLSGILNRSNNVFATAAPGAVVVAMTNAPAGSPAAPARYLQIPDGAGGVWTIPSLT
jgi:hypothetical protein